MQQVADLESDTIQSKTESESLGSQYTKSETESSSSKEEELLPQMLMANHASSSGTQTHQPPLIAPP